MDSTTSEMSSIVFSAASIASMMSFHLRTSSASNSPEKSGATRASVDASPSLSSWSMASRSGVDALHRLGSLRSARRRLVGHLHEEVGLLAHLRAAARSTPVEHEQVGDGQHVVDDVVELLGERVDVLAVERRDEGRVQPTEDRRGELVAAALALPMAGDSSGRRWSRSSKKVSEIAWVEVCEVRRRLFEEREEPLVDAAPTEIARATTVPARSDPGSLVDGLSRSQTSRAVVDDSRAFGRCGRDPAAALIIAVVIAVGRSRELSAARAALTAAPARGSPKRPNGSSAKPKTTSRARKRCSIGWWVPWNRRRTAS